MPVYVHSPRYRVDIGAHVFPTAKYDLLRERLSADGDHRFVEPDRATDDEVLAVHERHYYEACRDSTLTFDQQLRMELPWSAALFDATVRCVRGSIMAGQLAVDNGVGLHIGGGFHHAFAGHGEGFCVFNDPACAIRKVQAEERIQRALVVDVDLHQGNGTAAIFADDPDVSTFSIHQGPLYPFPKPPSTVDVDLDPGTDDDTYLDLLDRHLVPLLEASGAELLVYVAGADPYREDQLGSLALSIEGLQRRDAFVTDLCAARDLPMMVVLAGGYARNVDDTVTIHLNTLRETARLWKDGASAEGTVEQ